MPYLKICLEDEKRLERMIRREYKSERFEDDAVRALIGKQKSELSVSSKYYDGNIAEGNWSLLEDDSYLKYLDSEIVDKSLVAKAKKEYGVPSRDKDSEYTYIVIPSYYAVKRLILYYLRYRAEAKRIYGLRNAVVTRDSIDYHKFYGGLPFVLRYLSLIIKDTLLVSDFMCLVDEIKIYKEGFDKNNMYDDFINDIIDCLRESGIVM